MFKFFWNSVLHRRPGQNVPGDPSWRCDPLAHPVVARMTPTELADLPLARFRNHCERGS